jgi:hypothetical protein
VRRGRYGSGGSAGRDYGKCKVLSVPLPLVLAEGAT